MRIMGIDGSLNNTGIAIVEDNKVILTMGIVTDNKDKIEDRIYQLVHIVKNLIDKNNPDIIIIEDVFVYINSKTIIDLARLNGALLASCRSLDKEVILCPPTVHKKATVGNGQATKEDTIKAVEECFNITVPYLLTPKGNIKKKKGRELKNDNIGDALSLCCWYLKNGGNI